MERQPRRIGVIPDEEASLGQELVGQLGVGGCNGQELVFASSGRAGEISQELVSASSGRRG